jgi:hypothetical protein
MFERKTESIAPLPVFVRRMALCLVLAATMGGVALAIGVLGYRYLAGFGWVDALLDASMILGGMGPVGELHSSAAKVFASAYALFSGLVFIGIMGVTLSPILHRMLHHFHLADEDLEDPPERKEQR